MESVCVSGIKQSHQILQTGLAVYLIVQVQCQKVGQKYYYAALVYDRKTFNISIL